MVCKIYRNVLNKHSVDFSHKSANTSFEFVVFQNVCCVILYVCVILTVSIVCGVPSCISGYMGERCQFSDLEWWELQQAEQEKRRNVAIALGMVVLITLLSIAACVTYCYG